MFFTKNPRVGVPLVTEAGGRPRRLQVGEGRNSATLSQPAPDHRASEEVCIPGKAEKSHVLTRRPVEVVLCLAGKAAKVQGTSTEETKALVLGPNLGQPILLTCCPKLFPQLGHSDN